MKLKTARRWLRRNEWRLISRGICKANFEEIKGKVFGSDRKRMKECLKTLKLNKREDEKSISLKTKL